MRDRGGLKHDQLVTLWSVLAVHAEDNPGRVATVFDGKKTSYGELKDNALTLAHVLAESGFGRGDRIGYLGKNSDLYFSLLFAVARIGAVLVPLNWRLATDELEFIVADSQTKCLFSDDELAADAKVLASGANIPCWLINEVHQRGHANRGNLIDYKPNPDAVVFQVYTSGTTGTPKGAMLTGRNLLALREPGYSAGLNWFPQPHSIVGQVLPVAHIAGTAYAMFGFYAGARVVLSKEFDAGSLPKLIATEQISDLLLAPAAMQLMMEHPAAADANFTSLKYITYGAAPIPEALLRKAIAQLGCGFVQMYGMSEAAGGVVALEPQDHVSDVPGRMRSAGRAMPGVDIAIIDENWRFLPTGSTGEVVVRSPSNMPGYWKRPDANAEVFGTDGWMRTGDIGQIDDDGYLFILDRAKDMIISGGENIYPAEVENAIYGHPDIADVAVVGAPSDRWGEEVVALIVPRPGTEPNLASVLAWLDGKLARFKLPKQLVLVDSLPRNAGNKILRRVLREPFWEGYERRVN